MNNQEHVWLLRIEEADVPEVPQHLGDDHGTGRGADREDL